MKKILKEAVVLFIIGTLFFSTVAIADTKEDQIQISKASIKSTKSVNSEPIVKPAFGPVIFSQTPTSPDADWQAYTSDFNMGYLCIDDFWELSDPICDIHWWGFSLRYIDGWWYPCDPTGIQFEIVFYDENGNPVCTYAPVIPIPESTGQYYNDYELFYWEYDLDPCCNLINGWVSIQSIYSPNDCAFLWMNSPDGNNNAQQDGVDLNDNLAFELTTEICDPNIDVEKYAWDEKNQKWVDADTQDEAQDIKICKDTTFLIEITNYGDIDLTDIYISDQMHDSLKYIRGEPQPNEWYYEEPFYYINWFLPEPLPPGGIIKIYVYAHVEGPECSYDYNYALVEANGCGTIVSDFDYAWVHAHDRAREFNRPILNFLQNHPKMFPLLQIILQKLDIF
jgi:hypothetical protein